MTAQDCSVLCNLASLVIKEMQKDQLLLEKENSGQVLQRRNSKLNVSGSSLPDCQCSCLSLAVQLINAVFVLLCWLLSSGNFVRECFIAPTEMVLVEAREIMNDFACM